MEDQNANSTNQQNNKLTALPNSVLILIFGIISITTFCSAIIGLVFAIIAVVMAGKSKKLWDANPGMYSQGSYNNLKAGKICAIIGLIVSGLSLVYWIIVLLIAGTVVSSIPWSQF